MPRLNIRKERESLARYSLSVYKNARRLGVAKDGLAGEYCFFPALLDDDKISIERGTPP